MAGLYIHIPFCLKKCAYCDFVSFPEDGVPAAYVEALLKEIRLTARQRGIPHAFDTVFFGGGTPSLLTGDQLAAVLGELRACFSISAEAEISLECNPGTAEPSKLFAYRSLGVNRLSIGFQSAADNLLQSIGRVHSCDQFLATVRMARSAGFENISADVMYGLPGQSMRDYMDTLRILCDLSIQHVSAYSLILEENTPLWESVRRGAICLPDEDLTADMQDAGIAFLNGHGFIRYEISNFATEGFACRHNLNYWNNGEYLGLGVAAHSVARLSEWTRWANTESLPEYLRLTDRGKRPVSEIIRLFPADEMFECVMLGFRLVKGIDRAAFRERFGVSVREAYPSAFEELQKRGWLVESDSSFALSDKGLDMQNRALQLFM